MNLFQLLEQKADEIIEEATKALTEANLNHYKKASIERNEKRFKTLFYKMFRGIKTGNLEKIREYIENIVHERFMAGYELQEVQIAFNLLELAFWTKIIEKLKLSEIREARKRMNTVFGMGRDTLIITYVSLASKYKAPSIEPSLLLKGTDGV